MKTSMTAVNDFLTQRSFAIVGVSRASHKFGNTIFKTLKERGYKVFPVNPNADSIEGERCYHNLRDVPETVGGVVICVHPAQTEKVVQEALEVGVGRVWMQQGAESYAALRFCEKNEMSVVHGHCVLMFAEPVKSVHRFHRWAWKLIGKYPS